MRATAAIHFPDGREISAFRCGRRSLPSHEMTMMVAPARGRRPARAQSEGRISQRRLCSHLRSALARQDACCHAALVICFAGGKIPNVEMPRREPAVQFTARAPDRHEWRGRLVTHMREKITCGQAQFFMAARACLAPRPLASLATTHCQFKLMFETVWPVCIDQVGIPHLRGAIYMASHIWVGRDSESRYG